MRFTLQFPIADLRRLAHGEGAMLRQPSWPTPEERRHFIHHFGPVRKRLLGGSGVKWMGDELHFCEARRAVRFANLGRPNGSPLRRVLRRVFVHPPVAARVEVGWAYSDDGRLTAEQLATRQTQLLSMPAVVPTADGTTAVAQPLGTQGRALARLWRVATTPRRPTPMTVADWLVRDGEPMLLVEYGRDEVSGLPADIRHLPLNGTRGFRVGYGTALVAGRTVVVWYLEASPAGESKVARRGLRLSLLRLHTEYQVLKLVLNTLATNPELPPAAQLPVLDKYLDTASRRLFAASRFGIDQTPLFDALATFRELVPDEHRGLVEGRLGEVTERVRGRVRRVLTPAPTDTPEGFAGDQRRRLRGVLVEQFPNRSDLAMLLDDTLGKALNAVTGGENHTDVCFHLVQWLWIDPLGRLRPFLAHAVSERPNNTALKAVQRELFPA